MQPTTFWLKRGHSGPLMLLAHGAGAPMDSEFMEQLSSALVTEGIRVWRFELAYMAERRQGGKRRPPPPMAVTLPEWRNAIAAVKAEGKVFIAGKSMGGRLASHIATEASDAAVGGCICFGYPFVPPGKSGNWRTGHFPDLTIPVLIAQGERDAFGNRRRVLQQLPQLGTPGGNPQLTWIPEGDHDLRPPKRSIATWQSNLKLAAASAADFMFRHS